MQRTLGDPVVPDLQSSGVTVAKDGKVDTTRYNTIQHDTVQQKHKRIIRIHGWHKRTECSVVSTKLCKLQFCVREVKL